MRSLHALPFALLSLAACGSSSTPPATPTASAPSASLPAASAPPPAATAPGDRPPFARAVDASDTIDGKPVADPYRWMEEGADERDAFLRAQGDYAAQKLAGIPGRAKLLARILELGLGTSLADSPFRVNGRVFYWATPAQAQTRRLMVLEKDGSSRVLVDPDKLAPAGSHASVDNYAPSPDGKLVAYNLAVGGGEITSVHVLDVTSGKETGDVLDRIWGEFSVNWLPDAKGFFYTQMADEAPGTDPMQKMRARLHRLGKPAKDDPILLGGDVPSGAWAVEAREFPSVYASLAGGWVIANAGGAHPESRVAVARLADLDTSGKGKTPWVTVARYEDGIENADVHGDHLYLLTHKDAPNRRILSVPLAKPDLTRAKVEVAEPGDGNIVGFQLAKDGLYVRFLEAGHTKLQRVDWGGKATTVSLPFTGTVESVSTDVRAAGAVMDVEGWTNPPSSFAYDPTKGTLAPLPIATKTPVDTSLTLAEEVEVTSEGGVKVPLSILRSKAAALDGNRPTILSGYGGYGISETPWFSSTIPSWLERGGVYAVCHVRGGGEKGEAWHRDGIRDKKMNGIRDFIACGDWLVAHGYTKNARMAGTGGSMGGVLIGRALTERPDLFVAAQIDVGMVNPVRITHAENGENQLPELGSPDDPAGLRGLYAMDPYLHVRSGVSYPATLFTIGLHDGRVAPWMSGKMAARMQASTTSDRPILVRVDVDAGHGIGSTREQVYVERADVWSFFLQQMGEPGFADTK